MNTVKRWYQSKMMWINILSGLGAVVAALNGVIIPSEVAAALITVLSAINVGLRRVTDSPVTFTSLKEN